LFLNTIKVQIQCLPGLSQIPHIRIWDFDTPNSTPPAPVNAFC